MNNEEKYNVTVENSVKELIIRHGDAPNNPKEPQKIEINCMLPSVAAYIEKREIDNTKAHLEISINKKYAKFYDDPKDPLATVVKGSVEFCNDFLEFGINSTTKIRDRQALKSFLKQNRIYFVNKDAHAELLSAIENFNAKVDFALQQSETKQGSKVNNFSKNVTADVPLMAVIEIPLVVGSKPKKFAVEICYDVTENGAQFWFESVELSEIMKEDEANYYNEIIDVANQKAILVVYI